MDDSRRDVLLFIASQLVFVAALIHLGIGSVEWLRYASLGILVPPDIRWPLFVGSGLAVLAGMGLAYRSSRERVFYVAGIVAMVGYVVAYFGWHIGGHRPLFLVGPSTGHELTLSVLVDHYFAGPMETISLTVELVAAGLLAILAADADQ